MRYRLFILMLALIPAKSFSQKTVTTSNADSSFIHTREERLDEMINLQKEINSGKQTMPGYRIQIYFGGNRQKASEVKLDFNNKYPNTSAYITYQQPNFKVRIGDFHNRFEAQKFLTEIDGVYPTSFIVPDEVKLPSIK